MDYVKGNTLIQPERSFQSARRFRAYAKKMKSFSKVKETVKSKGREVKANDGVS